MQTLYVNQVRAASRLLWRAIDAVLHPRRVHEMFAQVRNVFQEERVVAQSDVVEKDQVLMNLAHVAHVRHNRQTELPRQSSP